MYISVPQKKFKIVFMVPLTSPSRCWTSMIRAKPSNPLAQMGPLSTLDLITVQIGSWRNWLIWHSNGSYVICTVMSCFFVTFSARLVSKQDQKQLTLTSLQKSSNLCNIEKVLAMQISAFRIADKKHLNFHAKNLKKTCQELNNQTKNNEDFLVEKNSWKHNSLTFFDSR